MADEVAGGGTGGIPLANMDIGVFAIAGTP